MLGAVLIGILLELLRDPGDSRVLFYSAILVGVVAIFRFSVRLAVVVGGTLVFGIVVHSIAGAIDNAWVNGSGGRRRRRRGLRRELGDRPVRPR